MRIRHVANRLIREGSLKSTLSVGIGLGQKTMQLGLGIPFGMPLNQCTVWRPIAVGFGQNDLWYEPAFRLSSRRRTRMQMAIATANKKENKCTCAHKCGKQIRSSWGNVDPWTQIRLHPVPLSGNYGFKFAFHFVINNTDWRCVRLPHFNHTIRLR